MCLFIIYSKKESFGGTFENRESRSKKKAERCAVVESSNKRDDGVVTVTAAKVVQKIKSTQLSPSSLMNNLDTPAHTYSHRIPIPSLTSLSNCIPATKFND